MWKALILDSSYYDGKKDHKLLVWSGGDDDGVIMEPWPNNLDGVQINVTREELLAIIKLVPVV